MDIELEILQLSYWEHFRKAKELAFIYPPEHGSRQRIEKVLGEMLSKINRLTEQQKNEYVWSI